MRNKIIPVLFALFMPFHLNAQQMPADTVAISLHDALQEALSNNELLKKASVRTEAGQASLQQAEGEMLPKIDANFSYGYLDIVPGFRKEILGNIQHDLFPSLSITQPIYTGGKLKHAKQAAETKIQALEQAFLSDQLNLKQAVTVSYFQLQSLIQQRQILLANRKQLKVQQRYTRLLVEAGRMSQLELERIGVAIAENEGKLLKIENDYQTESHQISLLLGRPSPQILVPQDSLKIMIFEENPDSLLMIALDHNPAWKQMEWELRRAEQNVKVQRAARLPQVSAQAYYGYEFGPESFSFDKNKRYFLGLNIKMPLYAGNTIGAKIDKARADAEQIMWQRKFFRKNLATQVKNNYSRLQERKQQIAIQQKALEQAHQSYRLALIEYHAGRRSNTDLLDILRTLLDSRLTLNQAISDYNIVRARLLAVMGIL